MKFKWFLAYSIFLASCAENLDSKIIKKNSNSTLTNASLSSEALSISIRAPIPGIDIPTGQPAVNSVLVVNDFPIPIAFDFADLQLSSPISGVDFPTDSKPPQNCRILEVAYSRLRSMFCFEKANQTINWISRENNKVDVELISEIGSIQIGYHVPSPPPANTDLTSFVVTLTNSTFLLSNP